MAEINGTAVITVDGVELESIPGTVKFKPGLTTAKARSGPRGFAGASVMPNMSSLQCDVLPVVGFNPDDLANGKLLTARVTDLATGDEWVIPQMVLNDDSEFGDGEDAQWSLAFEGSKGEKV